MKKPLYLLLFILSVLSMEVSGQGSDCFSADRLCEGTEMDFIGGVGVFGSDTANDYGCLYTQPNPAWFFLQVTDSGNIGFSISGEFYDIDFVCWGPFSDLLTACNGLLTDSSIVDCSYSTAYIEDCYIPNAPFASYYILLVTNYANAANTISITQTNQDSTGAASFSCYLTVGDITSNSPVCEGDTLFLSGLYDTVHPFYWTGPNGFYATEQNPVIPGFDSSNVGTYTFYLEADSILFHESIHVEMISPVIPYFTYDIDGITVWFTIQSAGDSNVFDFGDGSSPVVVHPNETFYNVYYPYGVYTATLYSYNQCFGDSISFYINVDGVSDESVSSVVLSPNPTHGKCRISGTNGERIEQISVRSIEGKLLLDAYPEVPGSGILPEVDFTPYDPGIYLLSLRTSAGIYNAKVIRTSE